ncbi:MAG: histidine triad nucleotide-binding protein [Oscillospiraceae bacterium]
MDCLFCKIIAGEIPSTKIYEDEKVYVFADIAPAAPIHWLAIPKTHITGADAITPENSADVARIYEVAAKLAAEHRLDSGFRIITNCGADAGQTVPHLHFHIMAGRPMAWPAG